MLDFLLLFCALLVLGALAASNIIIAKRPDAKEVLDKLAPHQGWIGIAGAVIGLILVIRMIAHMSIMIKYAFFYWLVSMASGLILVILGLLLSWSFISKFLGSAAAEKGEELRLALAPKQGLLGLVSIALAVLVLILYIAV